MRGKLFFAPEGFQEAGSRYTILPIKWSFVFCSFWGTWHQDSRCMTVSCCKTTTCGFWTRQVWLVNYSLFHLNKQLSTKRTNKVTWWSEKRAEEWSSLQHGRLIDLSFHTQHLNGIFDSVDDRGALTGVLDCVGLDWRRPGGHRVLLTLSVRCQLGHVERGEFASGSDESLGGW